MLNKTEIRRYTLSKDFNESSHRNGRGKSTEKSIKTLYQSDNIIKHVMYNPRRLEDLIKKFQTYIKEETRYLKTLKTVYVS